MTAEVAVLNKTAIAIAADSMVTISSGKEKQKVYDSADKLFELSETQPMGIMLYNGMSYMEMPLAPIIKDFRKLKNSFETVEQAANSFLEYLNDLGKSSSEEVKSRAEIGIVVNVLQHVSDRFSKGLVDVITNSSNDESIQSKVDSYLSRIIGRVATQFSEAPDPHAKFVGKTNPPQYTKRLKKLYGELVESFFSNISDENRQSLIDLCGITLKSRILSPSKTGLIFTGFGSKERFPSLVGLDIDGFVGGSLKFVRNHSIDIDRDGVRAAILPFAQVEMVDRFVYGIDKKSLSRIDKTCSTALKTFSKSLIDATGIKGGKRKAVESASSAAQQVFLDQLKSDTLDAMRSESVSEIQSMVEFMPKPEMAKMAEALVELTSIKRRVSRGVETVGGPIDVAVISREEGFVWIKRKHYFSADRNLRYVQRINIDRGV